MIFAAPKLSVSRILFREISFWVFPRLIFAPIYLLLMNYFGIIEESEKEKILSLSFVGASTAHSPNAMPFKVYIKK